MDARLLEQARAAPGFMPDDEGLALYEAGRVAAPLGPLLEVGSYAGKSAIYLGAAAAEARSVLFSVDHHRGSEENQPGWDFHDPRFWDESAGRMDTLPIFRRTVAEAGLEAVVVGVVGRSELVARWWRTPLALVFIDGGHTEDAAQADYEGWAPRVMQGGLLVIHDVFGDPAEGGQAPFHVYRRALDSGAFAETSATGSLRVLRRTAAGI